MSVEAAVQSSPKFRIGEWVGFTGAPDVVWLVVDDDARGSYVIQAYSADRKQALGATASVPYSYFDSNSAYHSLTGRLSMTKGVWLVIGGVAAIMVISLFMRRKR